MTARAGVVLFLVVSCSRASSPGEQAAVAPAPVEAKVAEIEAAYETGRSEGDRRYGDRTLRVTGYLTSVDDDQGRTLVWLGPDAPDAKHAYQDIPDPGLRCPLGGGGPSDPAQRAKAAALKAGSQVTIECKAGTATSADVMGHTVFSPVFYNCTL